MLPHIRYTELKFVLDADMEIREDDSTENRKTKFELNAIPQHYSILISCHHTDNFTLQTSPRKIFSPLEFLFIFPTPHNEQYGYQAPTDPLTGKEDIKSASVPLLKDADEVNEALRNPIFSHWNKFFGIPLSDSANVSPRWPTQPLRRSLLEKTEFTSQEIDTNASLNDPENYLNIIVRTEQMDSGILSNVYDHLQKKKKIVKGHFVYLSYIGFTL